MIRQKEIHQGLFGLRPVCRRAQRLTICVDPRLELLAVVQLLSGYGRRYPLLTAFDLDYARRVEEHFCRYRGHPAVQLLNRMIARPASAERPPFAFSAPPEVMLYLTREFVPREELWGQAFLVGRAGGRGALLAWLKALHAFFDATDFCRFYTALQGDYARWVAETRQTVGERDYLGELEAFFGLRQGSYSLILVPLYHRGGFGPRLVLGGVTHAYNIMGPMEAQEGRPLFGSREYLAYLQRHEFGHTFVNPLTAKHWPGVRAHFEDYASEAEAQELVNESVIRAITTWLAYGEGNEIGDRALAGELKRGFALVGPLLEALRAYAAGRERYADLDAYYPRLLQVFAGHRPQRYDAAGRLVSA